MLRKRSGAVGSKQVLMADRQLASPTARNSRTASSSSLFTSPRLFIRSFSGKTLDSDAAMSPTSILEAKTFSSSSGLSLLSEKSSIKSNSSSSEAESNRRIGLGIVDALNDENTRRVLIGSQLKIQIPSPPISTTSFAEFSSSPIEFGIKTKGSLLKSAASFSNLVPDPPSPALIISGCLPMNGMELSEDYTCVITRGPNPRTTHIFEDYIVESSGDDLLLKEKEGDDHPCPSMDAFLSFCHACNKELRHGNDTFMYRGERAFCSEDCRSEGIKFCS